MKASCLVLLALSLKGTALGAQSTPAGAHFDSVYNQLIGLRPVSVRSVDSLVLERDSATFTLSGNVMLLSPVDGQAVGAVFFGDGRFRFTPALEIERRQLARFDEDETVEREIESLFLLFTDDTGDELGAPADFSPLVASHEADRIVENALKFLVSEETGSFNRDVMAAVLNNVDGLFYSHFDGPGDPYSFQISPFDDEQVSVLRKHPRTDRGWELLAQEPLAESHPAAGSWSARATDIVTLSNYRIESWIDNNLDFRARAEFDVTPGLVNVAWAPLTLFWKLDVDSVVRGGEPVEFRRRDESSRLWVALSPAATTDDPDQLNVYYHGELLERLNVLREMGFRGSLGQGRLVSMRDTWGWFPRYRAWVPATFELTFHTPADRTFVSAGVRTSQSTEDEVTTSTWSVESTPNVAFNIGEFEEYVVDDPRIPPVTLQVAEKFHRNLGTTDRIGRESGYILQQANIEEMVSTDLANAMSFFQNFFGPSRVTTFNATEVPEFHGLAFPGLVHLSWLTYISTDSEGNDELFRAHEVAHQWWGIGVGHATYRDQWLSEGFSQFAGAWYLQMARLQNEEYFDLLDEWADSLIARGADAGPIGVGSRVATSEHPGDYDLIIYKKGAWVLHMLRNLMIDLDTMNEDRFGMMMQHFYRSFVGRTASTEDFRQYVEQYAGMPMDWFFDEWVYGSYVPTYEFAYNIEEGENGTFNAELRVDQKNVPDDFKMIVPVLFDFGDQGNARVRMLVEGPQTTAVLELPAEPENIVLNDLHSVLARVRNVGWERTDPGTRGRYGQQNNR